MLNSPQRGFTLIELLIGLVIVAILLAMGAPSFSDWIRNSKIRTTAEAVQNGLQIARGEAVRRNTLISFQLVSSLDSSCALSTSGSNWVVSLTTSPSSKASAAGLCDKAPKLPPADPATAPDGNDPYIFQKYDGSNAASVVSVAAGQSAIQFNGLGRVNPVTGANINVDVNSTSASDCKASGGNMRCLRLQVTPSGQVRMCDPSIASSTLPDPQACT